MTPRGRDPVGSLFKLLSALAETSVFLFIGSSLFLDQQELGTWGLLPFLVSAGSLAGQAAPLLVVWLCMWRGSYTITQSGVCAHSL
jgi:hypothetical protein